MLYVVAWLKAFLFTLAVEVPIAGALFRDEEARLGRRLGLVFFANLASHPAVWFILPVLVPSLGFGDRTRVVVSEAWAVAIEAVFYVLVFEKAGLRRAAGVSAVANGASFALGLALRELTGWV